ncbi:MAG: type II toxin-antitoxin system death-on-curing family toxin [Halobacteriota archaeon]
MSITYVTCDEARHAYHVMMATIEGEHRACLHPGIYENMLSSCLERPQVHFQSYTPYPDVFSKAAALLECVISSNTFIDGSKRMGFLICDLFLERNGYYIDPKAPIVQFVLAVAKGGVDMTTIKGWLQAHAIRRHQ